MSEVQEAPVTRPEARNAAITDEEKAQYVKLVGAGVSKGDAAKMLERSPQSFSRLMRGDQEFKSAVDEAWVDGADPLIEEAERRGRDGWEEPIYQRGELVGHVRKYDSNLLMFSIKGRRPEYKENPKIDVHSQVAVRFDDRSAAISEMWRVLADAGVDANELGGGTPRKELPAASGVVAEPSDV